MKTFKNVFVVIFPLLLLLVVVQRANDNHVTLRDTWNYTKQSYNLNVQNFKDTITNDLAVFSQMSFSLPYKDEYNSNNLLENIWLTIKWFGGCIYQIFVSLFVILGCVFDTIVLFINTLILPIKVLYYIGGFPSYI